MPDILMRLLAALADRYRLKREIGQGGMATVYLADDLKHDRQVAVKVLRPELAAVIGAERFLAEIKVTAHLQHPHILPLFDSGQADSFLFYVMPYVEGESLRDRLRRAKQLPLEDALRIAAETARALDYAHRHGVIHRDVKPENILVTKDDGDALLADFGIGRSLEGNPADRLTETGILVGTPAYMSPEQAAGERQLDGRTDIYSLGVVLYELLTGEPPYTGPTAQAIIAKRFSGEVPQVRRVRPTVPESVERVLQKALASTPADRFTTAAQFAEALGTAASGATNFASSTGSISGSVSSGHSAAVTTVGRHRHRHRTALLVAGVLTALVTLFAWMRTHSAQNVGGGAKRLAVLPFENLGRPEQEYFADGVTDEITTRLGAVSGLGVISRRSAMAYKSTSKPLRQVGAELGVAYVLEGTVRWDRTNASGGRVRVTPQLIEVNGDRQVWAKSFEVDLSDVFGVQRQIAEEVARSLGVTLLPSDTSSTPRTPSDLAAYDAYLRGNEAFFQMASTGGNVAKGEAAIAAYREALRLDPGLALAWARLAQAIAPMLAGAPTHPQADPRRASEAAQRSVALAPDHAESHLAMAAVSSGEENKKALKQAYALAPTDPQVLQVLARRTTEAGPHEYDVLVFRGVDTLDARWRCQASLQLLERATVLDPRSIPILRGLSSAYRCLGNRQRSEAAVNAAIQIAPELAEQWQVKAGLHLERGDLARARAVLREAKRHVPREELVAYMAAINDQYWVLEESDQQFLLRMSPDAFGIDPMGRALAMAHTLALRGDSVRARAYADTVLNVIRRHPEANLGIYQATALAYLHRREEALAVLRRSVEDGPGEPAPGWNYIQLQAVRTYNILGDRDAAIAAFLRYIDRTDESLPLGPGWRLDPITAPLRGDPRYEALFGP